MSSLKNNISSTHAALGSQIRDALHVYGYRGTPPRSRTPNGLGTPAKQSHLGGAIEELVAEEDPKMSVFRELYARSEARLESLFEEQDGDGTGQGISEDNQPGNDDGAIAVEPPPKVAALPKKATRTIDEDDYDDSDGEDEAPASMSPLKSKSAAAVTVPPGTSCTPMKRGASSNSVIIDKKRSSPLGPVKSSEDVRKKLEEEKRATEDAAKRSFHTLFYTLENDRAAMLDQKKLDESERQVDVEMGGTGSSGNNTHGPSSGSVQQGTLSQTNLGASSLTFKHLIARIDAKRDQVRASDAELRSLMSEVRKNRSKWASEEKVGQEELYEAAERVLTELKAYTEHSTAFLTKVNKREAPDYYLLIKSPMDLGTMTKKLKAVQYKSKQEFVDDLGLIWANCLKYNANPEHFLRRHALFMRKKAEELVPMIPAIVIKDRADVEAEERRLLNGDADIDGGEESDDEPIISSRGRKAPSKKSKKGTAARKAPAGAHEGSPAADVKPSLHSLNLNSLGSNLKNENLLRADSESVLDGSTKDLSTPPPGAITPVGVNGIVGHGAAASGSMDIDGAESSINGVGSSAGNNEEPEHEDIGYKTWKQVTKRDRALVTAERHRLFKGDQLNPDEPALLRTKMGMRRWLRKQRHASTADVLGKPTAEVESLQCQEAESNGETLAEGMEGDEERVLPDYYDTLAAVPDLSSRLRWIEDATGEVQDPSGEFLRILPKGLFTSPESGLTKRIEDNMRQMQQTRKICSKIAAVKQMQIQAQMYHGQFQKHEPGPFVEMDVEPHVMSDDGPVVAPWVSRAALQRSVGKLFFHAGFDEFQPAALEAVTNIAGDFFTKIARTFNEYMQTPKTAVPIPASGTTGNTRVTWKDRFTSEEVVLHTLHENGCDIEALETYIKDDVERSSAKLAVMHERMKAHLADLLRPALNDAGPDGSNAFNDGSEQFVGGDFAEELGEDFFGFKELGLDQEFGLSSMAVPLHLLQNRVHRHNQALNPSSSSSALPSALPLPTPLAPITIDNVKSHIGLVHQYFLDKLRANNDAPLIEDDDLPQKQRFPKPRLPPTGKISSPRKRPLREPGPGKGHPRKKMKLEDGKGGAGDGKGAGAGVVPFPKLKAVAMERTGSGDSGKEVVVGGNGKEKEKEVGGMMSPESLEAT